jgi:hypothetical protein
MRPPSFFPGPSLPGPALPSGSLLLRKRTLLNKQTKGTQWMPIPQKKMDAPLSFKYYFPCKFWYYFCSECLITFLLLVLASHKGFPRLYRRNLVHDPTSQDQALPYHVGPYLMALVSILHRLHSLLPYLGQRTDSTRPEQSYNMDRPEIPVG